MTVIPNKLRDGDEIRVIAPATSLIYISAEVRAIALANLERMNLRVSFSKNAEESDLFSSSSIASRVEDVHAAFLDPNIKGILTSIGGYNSNQLLSCLDYDLIYLMDRRSSRMVKIFTSTMKTMRRSI